MASQITHALAGEAALKLALPSHAASILGENGAWFRLGCQGPDLFYHNQRTRPLAVHYGSLVHRRSFGALLSALGRQVPDPSLASPWSAWTLGFSTHAAVDRGTHPFIVYKAGWADPSRPQTAALRGCHPFFERLLDSLLWERRTRTPIREFFQARALIPAGGLPCTFPERVATALRAAYGSVAGDDVLLERRVANAFEDSALVYRLSDPSITTLAGDSSPGYAYLDDERGPRSVSIVYPEDFPREPDWANEGRNPWSHPCDPPRQYDLSYFDLVDRAEREAALCISALAPVLRGESDGASDLASLAGNGTLNVGNAEGIQAKPLYMEPLPLPAVMADQFARRLDKAARSIAIDRERGGI